MAKGLKDVERIDDNLSNTIKWCGSMYNYLSNAVKLLNKLLQTEHSKSANLLYKQIHYELRYATNSQRRGINRFYPKVKSGLKDVEEFLPEDFKTNLGKIMFLLKPNEAVLTRETSFYAGELKSDFRNLKAQLTLLKKDPQRLASVQALVKKYEPEFKKYYTSPFEKLNAKVVD